MPELVMAGKLYKAVPPLYELDDKKHPFARDKQEYISLYQDKIVKNYEVALGTGKKAKALTGTKFKDFIYNTEAYPEELERIAKHFSINKFLIEIVASFIILNDIKDDDTLFSGKTLVKFLEVIQSKFPEIIIKDGTNTLRGPIDGKYQSVAINDRFFRKIDDIRSIIEEYGYNLTVSENGSPKKEMSIGEFLDDASKYKIKIIRRFKGLGEATSKQLWDTTLNPDTRILIQLTMDDVMKDLKTFEKIHGQGKLDLAARKVMMAAYKIKREDLDN
jgi:DNA gyrase subunit B